MNALYYFPGNATLLPHMALREIGVPFELRLVDRSQDAQHSAEYLKLNPNGLIPVLVQGNLVLFETAAITLHLADQHPNTGLAPPPGTAGAGSVLQVDGPPDEHTAGRVSRLVLPLAARRRPRRGGQRQAGVRRAPRTHVRCDRQPARRRSLAVGRALLGRGSVPPYAGSLGTGDAASATQRGAAF